MSNQRISRYEEYQKKIFGDFGIKKNDLVLDIGSGENPFPSATTITDLYPNDNIHREGLDMVKDDRLFANLDVQSMPLVANKSFDFVYCSHVLEHVNNPEKACQELMRVGKRGYIETPSRLNEILFGHKTHRWIIEIINNTLFFQKLKDWEAMHILSKDMWKIWGAMMLNEEPKNPVEAIFYKLEHMRINYPQSFYTMFQWKDSFEFKVIE